MRASTAAMTPQGYLQAQSRWHPLEIAFWLATLLPFVLFPDYLSLASQIAITALFALSLDIILGYAGIVSLGHAAFFGIGAYSAGLLSKYRLGRTVERRHIRRGGCRRCRPCHQFRHCALPPFHPDHDHAWPRFARFRSGKPRALAHRRQRRPAGRIDVAGARTVQVRSLWIHRLHLFARRPLPGFPGARGA